MSEIGTRPVPARILTRLKRGARRYGAVLVWVGAAVALAAWVGRQPRVGTIRGVTESVETAVAPVTDGVVSELAVDLLEEVKPGQTIAVMDDRLIRAEQAVANAQLDQLRAQLDADEEELRQTAVREQRKGLDERRRFAMDEEQARLDHLEMVARQEEDMVDLERLKLTMEREEALVTKGMTPRETYDNARLQYEALNKKIRDNGGAIAAAERMRGEAAERQKTFQAQPEDVDLQRILEPVRKAITVQEATVAGIQERRKGLILVSPGAGQVTSVFKRGGEMVPAGEPVVMVRMANTMRVVAYVNEKNLCDVPVGAHARLSSRYRPELFTEAQVVRVGAQIQPLPPRLQINPMVPEFGMPIVLSSLNDPVFYPGECVNVALDVAP